MRLDGRETIELLKADNRLAFENVFNNYFPKLYHFCVGYLSEREVAENIVQDTFVDFWLQRRQLHEGINLNAWLYTITKNKCLKYIDRLKVEKRYKEYSVSKQKAIELNHFALSQLDTSNLTFTEIESIIERTLEELPPQCRKVFELSRFESKKYKEISEELNISVKTVEAQMSKALKIFKTNLKDYIHILNFIFF